MTSGMARGLTLAELSDEECNERFDHLQERMRGVWEIMRRNEEGESVVVIPSVSVDRVGERSGSLQQAQRHPQSESNQSSATGMTRDWSNRDPRSLPGPMSIPLMRMTARTLWGSRPRPL